MLMAELVMLDRRALEVPEVLVISAVTAVQAVEAETKAKPVSTQGTMLLAAKGELEV